MCLDVTGAYSIRGHIKWQLKTFFLIWFGKKSGCLLTSRYIFICLLFLKDSLENLGIDPSIPPACGAGALPFELISQLFLSVVYWHFLALYNSDMISMSSCRLM